MQRAAPDLNALLVALNPHASLAGRHLWLIGLMEWIRGDCSSAELAANQVALLLDTVQAQPALQERLRAWWQVLTDTLDATTLLADYGFAPRAAFLSELGERLRHKLLPRTPETVDAAELFTLLLPRAFDAQWLALLDDATLERIGAALTAPSADPQAITTWQRVVLEAITYCASQIRATGFSPEVRLRMSAPARDAQAFHALAADCDTLRAAYFCYPRDEPRWHQAVAQFKLRLEACRHAAGSVYPHLQEHGISVGLVFALRQLRERVLRTRELLDCLDAPAPA